METQAQISNRSENKSSYNKKLDLVIRIISVLALLFIFLVGIKVLGSSFKMMGGGFAKGLISVTSNPILGLFSGMFATVLIQS